MQFFILQCFQKIHADFHRFRTSANISAESSFIKSLGHVGPRGKIRKIFGTCRILALNSVDEHLRQSVLNASFQKCCRYLRICRTSPVNIVDAHLQHFLLSAIFQNLLPWFRYKIYVMLLRDCEKDGL